jgi:DNA-binding NarL/FixJ family response regulator
VTQFVVLEDIPERAVDAATRALSSDGAVVVRGWEPPARQPAVCVGSVASADDAAAAVLAALRGARLVVHAVAPREVVDQLCDDLRRLGDLDHRVAPAPGTELDDEQRALLALLIGGATLGEAAQALHLSRRTADRRLAAARAALGARSTPDALSRAAQLGVRPAQLPPRHT